MADPNEEQLWDIVDRIYASVERPELWPQTISAIGEFIGGGPHFWGVDGSTLGHVEAHCRPTVFLSRADLEHLESHEQEFGELIVRFLKIIFLSVLWSQSDVGAREAFGARMTQRYLQEFEPLHSAPAALPARSRRRRLLAALWE